jgi:hypothetical protein
MFIIAVMLTIVHFAAVCMHIKWVRQGDVGFFNLIGLFLNGFAMTIWFMNAVARA